MMVEDVIISFASCAKIGQRLGPGALLWQERSGIRREGPSYLRSRATARRAARHTLAFDSRSFASASDQKGES
jgi:hypothetical protein